MRPYTRIWRQFVVLIGLNLFAIGAGAVGPIASSQTNSMAVLSTHYWINLPYTDQDGGTMEFTLLAGPAAGTLDYYIRENYQSVPVGTPISASVWYYSTTNTVSETDSFTWHVSDGTSTSGVATINFILTTNTVPAANNQNAMLVAGASRQAAVLSYSHADIYQSRKFILATPPAHGLLEYNPGSYTAVPTNTPINANNWYYTPTAGYIGTDNFQWQASDGISTSSVGTYSFTITANHRPVANNLHAVCSPTGGVTVAANYQDQDAGQSKTVSLVGNASSGTVSVAGATFTYTPNPGFTNGLDKFTYIVNDTIEDSNVATVLVQVREARDRTGSLVILVVNDLLLPVISNEVYRLKADLEREGYAAKLKAWTLSGSNASNLWDHFVGEYNSTTQFLAGAILIGDLPKPQVNNTVDTQYGGWVYTDLVYWNLAYFQTQQVSAPPRSIWVSRIISPGSYGDEITLLRRALDANHDYRTGTSRLPHKAFYFMIPGWWGSWGDSNNVVRLKEVWGECDGLATPTSTARFLPDRTDLNGYAGADCLAAGGEVFDETSHGNNDGFMSLAGSIDWNNGWVDKNRLYRIINQIRFTLNGSCDNGIYGGMANNMITTRGGGAVLAVGGSAINWCGDFTISENTTADNNFRRLIKNGESMGAAGVQYFAYDSLYNDRTIFFGDMSLGVMAAPSNNLPVIQNFSIGSPRLQPPYTVNFSVNAADVDGTITNIEWFMNGYDYGRAAPTFTGTATNATFNYPAPGTYAVRVEVVDNFKARAWKEGTVIVTAAPTCTLAVATSGTGSGTVSLDPPGLIYATGTVVQATATSAANSLFTGWSGALSGTANPVSFLMTTDTLVNAAFTLKSFIITAMTSGGGTITPAGNIGLTYGAAQTYTIAASNGYEIIDVLIDGASAGPVASYNFSSVTSDHAIAVSFALITAPPVITSPLAATGTVGTAFSYAITALHVPTGFMAAGLPPGLSLDPVAGVISGAPVAAGTTTVTITATNAFGPGVSQSLTLVMTCAIDASAGAHGSITPSGQISVIGGTNPSFAITPDPWYRIAGVSVDGVSVGTTSPYTFVNITTNHMIIASFTALLAPRGTPQWWLAQHGWTDNFTAVELADADGDGIPNDIEYQTETDPTNALSRLAYNLVPYAESFENLAGWGGAYGSVVGYKGWYSGRPAEDQSRITNRVYTLSISNQPLPGVTHTNVLRFDTQGNLLTNSFGAGFDMAENLTYVDMALQFVTYDDRPTYCTPTDTGIKGGVYVNASSNLVVYHGVANNDGALRSNMVTTTTLQLESTNWYRVTITIDALPTNRPAIAMFQLRLNGVTITNAAGYADNWKTQLNDSGQLPSTSASGTWFRTASNNHAQKLISLGFGGTGFLDDLVVTTRDPFAPAMFFETCLLSVTQTGNGHSSFGSAPYRSVAVTIGTSTQIVYTADDWFRINTLTSNGAVVSATQGVRSFTQELINVQTDISNTVVFAEATPVQTGYTNVPTVWLRHWSEGIVGDHGDGFDVAVKYLLGLDPTSSNTFSLTINAFGVANGRAVTTVRRTVTGDLSPDGMHGYLKLQATDNLGGAFTNLAGTEITGATVFDETGRRAYTNTVEGGHRFFRPIIE